MAYRSGVRMPMSHKKIYDIMVKVTLGAAGVFLLINLISLNVPGIIAIAACLIAFVIALRVMKIQKVEQETQEFVASLALIAIIFIISLNSGASYSDDFSLFLAVLGVSGLYMEPKITKIQIIVMDIVLVLMGIIHPEKMGGIKQYALCLGAFTLAAVLFYMAIDRGKAFIELANVQTEEAEKVLTYMREMGDIIQKDFDSSSQKIAESTAGLKNGSEYITRDAGDVQESCQTVQNKIQQTGQHITALNAEVKRFESSLSENQNNMEAMRAQLRAANQTIAAADVVFGEMTGQMKEVADIVAKLSDISFKTTLLSLNAAVEASRAGRAGAGFAVVASEMKALSENSNAFSIQVTKAIEELVEQVEKTSREFNVSTQAIEQSENKMEELHASFGALIEQFSTLYDNIDMQNNNINQVDELFYGLNKKVSEMQNTSTENQQSVRNIIRAMDTYRSNVNKVVNNTRGI